MTPKEKALQIINLFENNGKAKMYAKALVNELLNNVVWTEYGYWKEVESEIKKL